MSNLLETVGRDNLLKGMAWGEVQKARDLLQIPQKIERLDIAIAYLLGVRQGKHDERQKTE